MKLKIIVFVATFVHYNLAGKYAPTWKSLDTRPIPSWYDEAKIGILIHWGVYSVPAFGSEWFWKYWKSGQAAYDSYMRNKHPSSFTYKKFAMDFTANAYNPDEWATLFNDSGAKYVVLTSKHHEGYTLWPSKHSPGWNVKDVGPHRDLLGDLARAVRSKNLKFGVYYSLYEWFDPLYCSDRANYFNTQNYVDSKMLPQLNELINNYKPSILWADGDWEANYTYWKSTEFLAWLYNESPVNKTIVVNDRWGDGALCKHGGFLTCRDRYNSKVLKRRKWENALSIDRKSWGYRENVKSLFDYLIIEDLLINLAQTVSCGGNLLINIGPSKNGTIAPIFRERLLQLGEWLRINGEAIYKSKPWITQNDPVTNEVWYTAKESSVYAIILNWPRDNVLSLRAVVLLFKNNETEVNLLGNEELIDWKIENNRVNFILPNPYKTASKSAWVLKITPSS